MPKHLTRGSKGKVNLDSVSEAATHPSVNRVVQIVSKAPERPLFSKAFSIISHTIESPAMSSLNFIILINHNFTNIEVSHK